MVLISFQRGGFVPPQFIISRLAEFTSALAVRRDGRPVISLDSYYRDLSHLPVDERSKVNFDEPASMDDELLRAQCAALSRGEGIGVPHCDSSCHNLIACKQRIEAVETVIVEGLFTLYWNDLRHLLHTSVYVDREDAICYARRLTRDVLERGHTPECVEGQYFASFVRWPTRRHAHVIIRGDSLLKESVATVMALIAGRPFNSPASYESAPP